MPIPEFYHRASDHDASDRAQGAPNVTQIRPPDDLPPPTVRREMEVAVRSMSTDELMAALEVVTLDLERGDLDDTEQFNARERQRALDADLGQRVRIFRMPGSQAAKYARDRESWAALAREVRQRVEIAEVLAMIGYPARLIGREWHGGCPACQAGDDRLLVRPGPEGRCWCRRCGFHGDAILLVRSFMPGLSGFRDATAWLANFAALEAER